MVGTDYNNEDCVNPNCTCDPCECTKKNLVGIPNVIVVRMIRRQVKSY